MILFSVLKEKMKQMGEKGIMIFVILKLFFPHLIEISGLKLSSCHFHLQAWIEDLNKPIYLNRFDEQRNPKLPLTYPQAGPSNSPYPGMQSLGPSIVHSQGIKTVHD